MRPLLVALLVLPLLAPAQQSEVTCPEEAQWAFNSLRQSPCVVGAYLLGACEADPSQVLVTKDIADARPGLGLPANACSCSSVTYSLLSVCSACAGAAHPLLWSAWSSECDPDVVQLRALPYWVPPGTAVPTWAFLDITKGNAFDPVSAGTTASLGEPDVLPSAAAAGDSLPQPTEHLSPSPSPAEGDGRNNTRGSGHSSHSPFESATDQNQTRTRTHSPFPDGSALITAPPHGGTAVPIVAGVLGALAGVAAVSSGIAWVVRRRSSRFAAISGRPRSSSTYEKYRQQQQQLKLGLHSRTHSRSQSLVRGAAIPLAAKAKAEAPAP